MRVISGREVLPLGSAVPVRRAQVQEAVGRQTGGEHHLVDALVLAPGDGRAGTGVVGGRW